MNLSKRSIRLELLDQETIPFADIKQNLQELNIINSWLGGHNITLEGFRQLAQNKKQISVCEIGCGGGDNLVAINRFCKKNGIELSVTGIDIKEECIEYAKSRDGVFSSATWIVRDYRNVLFEKKPDIIFSSLFCHHFTKDQLISQVQWMTENSGVGFFVNDLQRNLLAYYSIKLLTSLFSKSYLVKNDAPLSVARGFTKKELFEICKQAKLKEVEISWKWAFRYLAVFKHE